VNVVLPPIKEAFAYVRDGEIVIALHGHEFADDRRVTIAPALALQLAEALIRAVRNSQQDEAA
jgi:hypothetical protein